MDPLTQLLLQRQMGAQSPPLPSPTTPVVPPSGGAPHTPPEAQRFLNAQQMIAGYRNAWTPNPILTQVASGNK